jgi:hypothetical protein
MGKQNTRTICYGLMRACGLIGFGIGAAGIFYVASSQFGVTIGGTTSALDMTRQQIVVAVAAALAAMIGGLVGQNFGASIPVRDDETSQSIDAIWHFSANTVIVWVLALGPLFALAMGRGPTKEFWQSRGFAEIMWLACLLPTVAGVAIALSLWFSVTVVPKLAGALPAFVLTNVLPYIVLGTCGACAALECGLGAIWGLPMGLLAVVVMRMSARSMRKDKNRRIGG